MVKNLLVPSDLSEASVHAIDYAINMAVVLDAKVTLLHVFQPMPVSIDGVTMGEASIVQEVESKFESFVDGIKRKYKESEVKIESHLAVGFAVERILHVATETEAYMIVMATTGQGLMKKLFGSISTEVIKESDTPILLVPPEASYRMLKRVVYADDFTDNHDKGMQYLQLLLSEFLFSIDCVHISTEDEPKDEWVDLSPIKSRYEGIEFNQVELKQKTIMDGLMNYCHEHDVDMIIAPSRKKGFFFHLFIKSVTHEMAVATTLPLLIIH